MYVAVIPDLDTSIDFLRIIRNKTLFKKDENNTWEIKFRLPAPKEMYLDDYRDRMKMFNVNESDNAGQTVIMHVLTYVKQHGLDNEWPRLYQFGFMYQDWLPWIDWYQKSLDGRTTFDYFFDLVQSDNAEYGNTHIDQAEGRTFDSVMLDGKNIKYKNEYLEMFLHALEKGRYYFYTSLGGILNEFDEEEKSGPKSIAPSKQEESKPHPLILKQDDQGNTILMKLILDRKINTGLFKTLLKMGSDIRAKNNNQQDVIEIIREWILDEDNKEDRGTIHGIVTMLNSLLDANEKIVLPITWYIKSASFEEFFKKFFNQAYDQETGNQNINASLNTFNLSLEQISKMSKDEALTLLKEARRKLLVAHHPDKQQNDPKSTERTKQILNDYEVATKYLDRTKN